MKATFLGLTVSGALLWSLIASANPMDGDPLHAFCYGSSTCSDNGTVTPTTSNPPQFGFAISPGPQTGEDYLVDILVPDNDTLPASFAITATQAGVANTSTIGATATLVNASPWTSGDLTTYLGLTRDNGSPPNPLNAWLPSTQGVDAGATGYYVFQADLLANQLYGVADGSDGPLLSLGSSLDIGTVIVGFLGEEENCGTKKNPVPCEEYVSTAQSAALFEAGSPTPPPPVPEPGTLLLFGAGLGVLGFASRRIKRKTR